MSKQGYDPTPPVLLPTAPPPPSDASFAQPPYNPHMQTAISPPSQYQAVPVIHEMLVQGNQPPNIPQPYPQQVTVTENTVVVGVPLLVGPQALRTTCPNCRATIQTRTSKVTRGIAHLLCLGLCIFCCCLCSCIPYCMDSMKEVRHTCPKCKAHLGTYRS